MMPLHEALRLDADMLDAEGRATIANHLRQAADEIEGAARRRAFDRLFPGPRVGPSGY